MWAVIKVPLYINGGGIRYGSSSKNGCNSFVRGRKYSVKMCSTPGQNVQVSVKSKIEQLPIMVASLLCYYVVLINIFAMILNYAVVN